jgi:hypothetical protein
LRNADATMTGIIMRTCAQNTVLALPSMKFIARSRPGDSSSSSIGSSRHVNKDLINDNGF